MTDFLFHGDTQRSPAMRHELPVSIGDPFLLAVVGGQLHVSYELRARKPAPG
jgi:hypothetical protein